MWVFQAANSVKNFAFYCSLFRSLSLGNLYYKRLTLHDHKKSPTSLFVRAEFRPMERREKRCFSLYIWWNCSRSPPPRSIGQAMALRNNKIKKKKQKQKKK